jgi:hypothetical protein
MRHDGTLHVTIQLQDRLDCVTTALYDGTLHVTIQLQDRLDCVTTARDVTPTPRVIHPAPPHPAAPHLSTAASAARRAGDSRMV